MYNIIKVIFTAKTVAVDGKTRFILTFTTTEHNYYNIANFFPIISANIRLMLGIVQ